MIREFQKEDLDKVMEIWLDTNIAAHSFIESGYWESNYETVKKMMPSATIYIYEENNMLQGFIGLMGDYIAGIFVSQQCQCKGIGKKLLDYAKEKKERLSLHVYKENDRAVAFYLREAFAVAKEQRDEATGKMELQMDWTK